jgi:hypothetical protein
MHLAGQFTVHYLVTLLSGSTIKARHIESICDLVDHGRTQYMMINIDSGVAGNLRQGAQLSLPSTLDAPFPAPLDAASGVGGMMSFVMRNTRNYMLLVVHTGGHSHRSRSANSTHVHNDSD